MVKRIDAPASAKELAEFITQLHAHAEKSAGEVCFNKKDPYEACFISIHLSILELSGAFLQQLDSKSHILIPSTIRSLLETYVEFENLRKDKTYIESMEFYHLGKEVKVLERAKLKNNRFLADIAKMQHLDDIIKDHKDRRNKLLKKNAKALEIKDRFIKAGFEEWYDGLYGFLSGNTHPSISAIFYRHFARNEDKISIVYGKKLPPERMLAHLDLTGGLLLDASKKVDELYNDKKNEEPYKKFDEQLAKIRKKYE